jgi:hypothetical protein
MYTIDFQGYLSSDELKAVEQALVDGNFAGHDEQEAMLSPILPAFKQQLPRFSRPRTQLTIILGELNRVHNLRNGDVPLAQFLDVAATLARATPAADVIERALARLRYGGDIAAAANDIGRPAGGLGPGDGTINTVVKLEAQTGALDQTVSVGFLREGLIAAASVVKLLVHRHSNGHPEFLSSEGEPRLVPGTAWLIAPSLLITNHHVINARRKEGFVEKDASEQDFRLQAENTQILFDYVSKDMPEPILTGRGALLYNNKELDFALLHLPVGAPNRSSLRLRPHVMRKNAMQALGMGVNLLQHPNGKPMRLGFRTNYVVSGDDRWLSYLTDTDVGSSGSPVCDDAWTVAALHVGSRPIGQQHIVILGQEYRRENYGIPILTILAHLSEQQPALHEAIQDGQKQPG